MNRRFQALMAAVLACLTAGMLAGCGNKEETEVATPEGTMASPGAMASPAAGAPAPPPGPAAAPR